MKKILLTITLLTIVCSTTLVLLAQTTSTSYSVLQNVDYIVKDDFGALGPMCSQTGNPGSVRMKLCSNCPGQFGKYAMDRVAFCNN